jgi:hypothetical protein
VTRLETRTKESILCASARGLSGCQSTDLTRPAARPAFATHLVMTRRRTLHSYLSHCGGVANQETRGVVLLLSVISGESRRMWRCTGFGFKHKPGTFWGSIGKEVLAVWSSPRQATNPGATSFTITTCLAPRGADLRRMSSETDCIGGSIPSSSEVDSGGSGMHYSAVTAFKSFWCVAISHRANAAAGATFHGRPALRD